MRGGAGASGAIRQRISCFNHHRIAPCTLKLTCQNIGNASRFEATMGTRELRTEVKAAAAAEAEYQEAVKQGHSAAKVKQVWCCCRAAYIMGCIT
eukprot:205235-Pelagomonas_calceolata.AAC.1